MAKEDSQDHVRGAVLRPLDYVAEVKLLREVGPGQPVLTASVKVDLLQDTTLAAQLEEGIVGLEDEVEAMLLGRRVGLERADHFVGILDVPEVGRKRRPD